jgi:hypothetical protein
VLAGACGALIPVPARGEVDGVGVSDSGLAGSRSG